MDRPPVLDNVTPGLVDGAGDGHPAVVAIGLNSGGHVSLPQGTEGIALPLLVGTGLAAVGGEGDDVVAQLGGQGAQRPTGIDGGQLAVVADQDQLGPGRVDIRAELVERACPHHGRLVHDDHVPGGQPTALPEVGQELGQ